MPKQSAAPYRTPDNWFNFTNHLEIQEKVINDYSFLMTNPVQLKNEWIDKDHTTIKHEISFTAVNGYEIFISKYAKVKEDVKGQRFAKTNIYLYRAIRGKSGNNDYHHIRYDSPHASIDETGKDLWDYFNHRHEYKISSKNEFIIIYDPWEKTDKPFDKTYRGINSGKKYKVNNTQWPQIQNFLEEVSKL